MERTLFHGARRSAVFGALAIAASLGSGNFRPAWSAPDRTWEVYFPGAPHELHVYRIQGRDEGGPTLLVIGGIHGDEPGGFRAADRYVDLTVRRGNLILVPRANTCSIAGNKRGLHGDMNRRFREGPPQDYVDRVVEVLKNVMAEADVMLNLHDGSGFYSPTWVDAARNPMRYGQSVIADTDMYCEPQSGKTVALEELAQRVIRRVNPQIRDGGYHFAFSNHRTLAKNTAHPEQRASATFYALTRFGIAAYAVETSKQIPDYRVRVEYQTMVINAFMEEIGIVADDPPVALDLLPALLEADGLPAKGSPWRSKAGKLSGWSRGK